MIDIENQIYTLVRAALENEGVEIGSVYTESVSKYPYVFFEMANSSVYDRGSATGNIEVFADQTFEVSVYTKGGDRKTKAKEIANLIDGVLQAQNFRRIFYSPVPNFGDNNIYRIVLRYRVLVGQDNKLYNN